MTISTIDNIPVIQADIKDAKEYERIIKDNVIDNGVGLPIDQYKYCVINNNKMIVWYNQKSYVHFILVGTKEHFKINRKKNTLDYIGKSDWTVKEMLSQCVNVDKSKLS